jgi:hypothetical protein
MEVKSSSFGGVSVGLRGVTGWAIWKVGKGTGSFAGCRLQPPASLQWCLQEWLPHFVLIHILLQPWMGHEGLLTVVAERLPVPVVGG